MAKNAKVFNEINFSKEIIKDYITKHYEETGEEMTDDGLDQLFVGILSRIVEESAGDLKKIFVNPNYKYFQVRIIGLTEEPKNSKIDLKVTEDSVEVVSVD